jgi:hypothetical protein
MQFRTTGLALAMAACAALALSTTAFAAASKGEGPQVAYVPVNSGPTPPAGLKVACMPSPTVLTSSKTCPVLNYLGNTTWAYSYMDNRVSMAFVTYDANKNVVINQNRDGARYVWNIISSYDTKLIQAFGQSNQYVTLNWADLVPPPAIATVATNTIPSVPAGLKVACMANGSSLQPVGTCPVVKVGGLTTWALSYYDNRVSLAFVTFNSKGHIVRNTEMPGSRYVWQMTVNTANKTVTASGQSNATVTAPWTQFGPDLTVTAKK